MVTHNLSEAIELSDKILFFSASPSTVIGEYCVELPREQRSADYITQAKAEIVARQLQAEPD